MVHNIKNQQIQRRNNLFYKFRASSNLKPTLDHMWGVSQSSERASIGFTSVGPDPYLPIYLGSYEWILNFMLKMPWKVSIRQKKWVNKGHAKL